MRYHHTPVRMAIIKMTINNKHYLQFILVNCLFYETAGLPLDCLDLADTDGLDAVRLHPWLSSLNILFLSDTLL